MLAHYRLKIRKVFEFFDFQFLMQYPLLNNSVFQEEWTFGVEALADVSTTFS